MRLFATVAAAAALRLDTQVDAEWKIKASHVLKKCDTDNNGAADYQEFTTCMNKAGMTREQRHFVIPVLQMNSYIPKVNWSKVAKMITKANNVTPPFTPLPQPT